MATIARYFPAGRFSYTRDHSQGLIVRGLYESFLLAVGISLEHRVQTEAQCMAVHSEVQCNGIGESKCYWNWVQGHCCVMLMAFPSVPKFKPPLTFLLCFLLVLILLDTVVLTSAYLGSHNNITSSFPSQILVMVPCSLTARVKFSRKSGIC